MRKWLLPALVASGLLALTDQLGFSDDAWWLIPTVLFPIALLAMLVRKELTARAVIMLVVLSGIMALLLKVAWAPATSGQ